MYLYAINNVLVFQHKFMYEMYCRKAENLHMFCFVALKLIDYQLMLTNYDLSIENLVGTQILSN